MNAFDIIIVSVDYEEFKPKTYNGVFLYTETEIKRYNTGDFKKDFTDAKAFAKLQCDLVLFSSTIDHFVIDTDQKNFNYEADEANDHAGSDGEIIAYPPNQISS